MIEHTEEELESHSRMLSQIGCEVEEFCEEEMTTLDGVRLMKAELLELRGYKIRKKVYDSYNIDC